MDVHLRDLRYFVAVAEQLHFTRAAEALYISQPTLSRQVRVLEEQLRTPLFDRDHRSVRLTSAGAALLPAARAVLAAWREAEADLAAAAAAASSTLVVGMSTGVGRGLLPAVRARLAAAVPSAQLQIQQVPWSDPSGGLAGTNGSSTDAAFVWLPLPEPHRYAWVEVAVEPRLVALPAGHHLAGEQVIAFADLLDEPFIALPASSGILREHWLAIDHRANRPAVIGAEVSTAEEAVEALTAGLGITLLARGNAALLARDGIVLRPITGVGPAHLVLAWRRGDDCPLLSALTTAVGQVRTGTP